MAIKRTGRIDSNIESIERALEGMLSNLTAELEAVVSSGKVDKTKLETILSDIDAQIINNDSVKNYLLGNDTVTQTRVKNLIQEVQDAVQETIAEFRDSSKGKVLSEDAYEEVMSVYDDRVTGSATVKRTKVLDEFRAKSDSITFESTDDRLSATTGELGQVTDKLNKISAVAKQQRTGETLEQTIDRLSKDAGKITLNGDTYYNKISEITKTVAEGGYDFDTVAGKIAVGNYMYKNNPENCKQVSEFLTNLNKLREGNPEIESIFAELAAAGIKANKDGKFEIKQTIGTNVRKKLNDALNKKLMSKPIDFKKAKENTANAYFVKIDNEIKAVLSSDFIKLYPTEMQQWKEMLKRADTEKDPSLKDDVWDEIKKLLTTRDIETEILDVKDFEDEATLTARKAELEGKKKTLIARQEGERFEKVPDEVKKVEVMGIEVESGRNLMGLSEEDMIKASKVLYNKKQEEFATKFETEADPKLKKVGIFERIGYAISHRTLHPKKAIMSERIEEWSRKQISAAISRENEETARQQGARDYAYSVGALTPDQLKEFREKQVEILEQHKKKQEAAILEGTTKSADDASKKTKEDAEAELGE